MAMFWEFFTFELKFRFKSLSTYIYFAVWFAFSFLDIASEGFGPIGNSNGKVLLNGPYANIYNDIGIAFFGVIVIAAIFGTSILRDFQRDTIQILFTKPISKLAYLGGRWAGSFAATVFAFSGLLFGEFFGTLAPWADHARIGPNHLSWYLQPFFSIVVFQIFFLGSLFFLVAALSRKIFIVYLQGADIFMLYLIGITIFSATRSLEHFWSGILDPVGFLYNDAITRYWTVVERNTLLYSWSMQSSPQSAGGVFLYNRLLWGSVGLFSLLALWKLFPMSVEALTARSSGRRAALARQQELTSPALAGAAPRRSLVAARLPAVHQVFGARTILAQLTSLTRLRISNIVREVPFWGIAILMAGIALNNGHYAGRVGGVNVWPVTYLMLQSVEGGAALFFFIVATLYAAELVWRERDTHFSGIHDALPIAETTDWFSKFFALCFVELTMLTVTGLCGILMQTIGGYYHYELLQYAKELYVVTFPQVLTFALLALFLQTVVSNKFIGHGIVIGIFVIVPILFSFGWENTLYLYGNTPPYIYSDMNGYGHFVPALFWSIAYWLAISCFLATVSLALARRGADDAWPSRWRLARQRAPRLIPAAAFFLIASVGSGAWYFYNAHVLNEYLTAKDRRDIQAAYERDFKKYQKLPQPKTIAVDANIDIFPERRSFSGAGHFVLQNKTAQPIGQIHITNQQQSVSGVRFARPFHAVSTSPRASTPSTSSTLPWLRATSLTSPSTWATPAAASRMATSAPNSLTPARSSTPATSPPSGTTRALSSMTPAAGAKSASPNRNSCPTAAMPRAPSPTSSLHNPTGSATAPPSAPPTIRLPFPPATSPATGTLTAAIISLTTWAASRPSTSPPMSPPATTSNAKSTRASPTPSPSRSITPPPTPTTSAT